MMKFKQTRPEGSDCTASYDVTGYKAKTVGEFIQEVLSERPNDWGDIHVQKPGKPWTGCPRMEYRYGVSISHLPAELEALEIEKVDAIGGWTQMSYWCHVVEKR